MAARTRVARGPTDPTHRDRIADAALAIVLEQGVAAVSHRAVADRAGVPLGSTTYHFKSLDDLLVTARTRAAYDLYFAALHRPALMAPARAGVAVTRRALERHTSRAAARALTVLLDGVLIQALLGGAAMPRQELATILRAVLTALP
jgi:DNA-binding transcriptional regulator YbjK